MMTCTLLLAAAFELGSPFTDGMVLQRGMKVPVWGWGEPGADVAVSFAGQSKVARVACDGCWRVDLDPLEASSVPRRLTAGDKTVENVLVGEVWFASGQSNMALPLVADNPHGRDRNGELFAQMTYRPNVRVAYMKPGVKAAPQKKAAEPVVWRAFCPETLRVNVSAVAAYYAVELHDAIGVPIGIVEVYRSGSRLEPWVPNEGFRAVPSLKAFAEYVPVEKEFSKEALLALCPKIIKHHLSTTFQPSVHWNAIVEPWVPYAARGMIWYQGEANTAEAFDYVPKMHALYKGWSTRFENPSFRLYFSQLASISNGTFDFQRAQEQYAQEEPNAAIAIITDVGNPSDIHPNEKELVARRLAAHALRRDYGFDSLRDESPRYAGCRADGTNIVVRFHNAERMYVYNQAYSADAPFEVAGDDGVFRNATIVNLRNGKRSNGKEFVSGNIAPGCEIVLNAKDVAKPVKVRYLFNRPWKGTVFNESNLPLGPFLGEVGDANAGK